LNVRGCELNRQVHASVYRAAELVNQKTAFVQLYKNQITLNHINKS